MPINPTICKECGRELFAALELMRLLCDPCYALRRPVPAKRIERPPPYPDTEAEREAEGCCGSMPACSNCPFWEMHESAQR